MHIGKKIIVMGGSCSGKSTLAEKLGNKFNFPVLYLDLYDPYAVPEGKERDTRKQKINQIIKRTVAKDAWIIEGIYEWYAFDERLNNADTLILLLLPAYKRIWCYLQTCITKTKRHGRFGFSAKNFRWNHVWYMLRKHDAPYDLINQAIKKYPKLQVVKLKSYKEANKFLESVKIKDSVR
ncbi:MAG: hypothetical protein IJL05_00405 [Alphaproteobacteria bacterium]|nr:hypothetical protein [Alphaproteobacteria bacterium]